MPELRRLAPAEKLTLVTELWNDLASNPAVIPVTPEQIVEVERRLEEYRQNQDLGSSWEDVKATTRDGTVEYAKNSKVAAIGGD
jgi:putative addiction module component (TIGR02574 family)